MRLPPLFAGVYYFKSMSANYLVELLSKIGIVSWRENNGITVHFGFRSDKEPWKVTYADGVVYALIDNGNIVYIGCTLNPWSRTNHSYRHISNTRLGGHRKIKQYDRVLICHIVHEDKQYITDLERCMILRFTPKYNKQFYPPKTYIF